MKFSTREDVEVPIETVFSIISDFPYFEGAAIRRGIDVRRGTKPPDEMPSWNVHLEIQGKPRDIELKVVELAAPQHIRLDASSSGIHGYFEIDLKEISPENTRLSVACEFWPKTMPARMLIQPLKLAKNTLSKRFKLRVADYARQLEERCRRAT